MKKLAETRKYYGNRKAIKRLMAWMLVIVFAVSAGNPINVKAASKSFTASEVANYFKNQVGKSYPSGYCLAFVADTFANMGAARSSACCASGYGNSHISSTSIDNIPIGADVFFTSCGGGPCSSCKSRYYGHIGVYVGDGYFVHATGGTVQKTSLKGTNWKNKYRGWGYHSNVTISQPVKEEFMGCVDVPHNGGEYTGDVGMGGWAIYMWGGVSEVVCMVNGVPVCNCERYARPDVANVHPGYHVGNEGFKCTISEQYFHNGENQVYFRAFANNNSLYLGDFGHLTINYKAKKALQKSIDVIPENMVTEGDIEGWVVSEEANRIAIVVNGVEYEVSERKDRPDVKAVLPEYDTSRAGFKYVLNPTQVVNGTNQLGIRVYSGSKCTEIYNGTFQAVKMDSDLFDEAYYYGRYSGSDPVVKSIGFDRGRLLEDYLTRTLALGYSPSMAFDPVYYLSVNPDLAKVFGTDYVSAYSHFVEFVLNGKEMRDLSPFLNLGHYKSVNRDLGQMNPAELVSHFVHFGCTESRNASDNKASHAFRRMFSASHYAQNNGDLLKEFGDGTMGESRKALWKHFWYFTIAGNEQRVTNSGFNFNYVINTYKLGSTTKAFEWYIKEGYTGNYATVESVADNSGSSGKADGTADSESEEDGTGEENGAGEEDSEDSVSEPERKPEISDGAESEDDELELPEWDPEDHDQDDGEDDYEEEQETVYQVEFKSNGVVVATQTVAEGEQVKKPESPLRKGYVFTGWYMGRKPYDFAKVVERDFTLTAKWRKVSVAKVKIKCVKNQGRKLSVSYSQEKGAMGYEIECAVNKKFSKAASKTTAKTAFRISGIKKNITYYIRIRAYKIDSTGTKVYGKWSSVKRVKG